MPTVPAAVVHLLFEEVQPKLDLATLQKAILPSRGGRFMVTPPSANRLHVA